MYITTSVGVLQLTLTGKPAFPLVKLMRKKDDALTVVQVFLFGQWLWYILGGAF